MQPSKSSRRTTILLILATCLNLACATITACNAALSVKIFGFDLNFARIYYGPKDHPTEVVYLNDPHLETDYLCLSLTDWTAVRNHCGIH